MRDPYSLLGVKRSANADEIKAAWRSKAKVIHPDHNQDDPSAGNRFAEVGQAYELLKDPERRKRYDRAADMHQTIHQQREAARQAAERAKESQANAEKVMEELARANAQRAQAQAQAQAQSQSQQHSQAKGKPQPGQTGEAPEDMVERIFGVGAEDQPKEDARARTADAAAAAAGNTASADAATDRPDTAGETKQPLPVMAVDLIASLVRRIRGTAPLPEKAPDLFVDATVTIADLLKHNWVSVHLPDERDVRFALERGMTEGQMVRLKGQGIKVPNMKQGDLMITLKVAKDAHFRIDGFDIHTVLPISLEDAVLGTELPVETLEGHQQVVVPAWSGSDQSVRLQGLGLHDGAGSRGDLVVELRILLWEKPDPKVTDLMRHMRHGLYL